MDLAEGNWPVQQIATELADPAEGAVADQGQPEDRLVQPLLGNWQVEENFRRLVLLTGERLLEGLLGTADLLIDELAADLVLGRQPADGFRSCQGV